MILKMSNHKQSLLPKRTTLKRSLLVVAVFSLLCSQHALAAPIPYNADYSVVKPLLATPQSAAEYMTAYFQYEGHWGYMPKSPSAFNSSKSGDCKDYATFFGDILLYHSYAVDKYAFRYDTVNGWSHIVTIFTDTDGKQYVASNKNSTQKIYGPVNSLEEAGSLLLADGVLPEGSVADQWLKYPADFTGQLQDSNGFVYNADYQTSKAQFLYFQHPAIYMTAYFSLAPHPGAYAYPPEELNLRKSGDAKDFAVFSAQNAHSDIHSFRCNDTTNDGHFISVNTYDGEYYFQSNQYFFGPVDTFNDIVSLLKENKHIPANCVADSWQSYPYTYTGPFPVANPVQFNPVSLLLFDN